MDNLLKFAVTHKTIFLGLAAIISGLITMATADGDPTLMNTGWTQVLGGFGMIFLNSNIKKTERKIDDHAQALEISHNTLMQSLVSPQAPSLHELQKTDKVLKDVAMFKSEEKK